MVFTYFFYNFGHVLDSRVASSFPWVDTTTLY